MARVSKMRRFLLAPSSLCLENAEVRFGSGRCPECPRPPRPTAFGIRPMLAKLNMFALVGIEAVPVEAEVDVSAGLPKTVLVGIKRALMEHDVRYLNETS